jgi:hypothetical protein
VVNLKNRPSGSRSGQQLAHSGKGGAVPAGALDRSALSCKLPKIKRAAYSSSAAVKKHDAGRNYVFKPFDN